MLHPLRSPQAVAPRFRMPTPVVPRAVLPYLKNIQSDRGRPYLENNR